jgi:hypothetical protein
VHLVDVVLDGHFVFEPFITGYAVVQESQMKKFHLSSEIETRLDGLYAEHADETSGTF